MLDDLLLGARLLAALPGTLARTLDPATARAALALRLRRREADFLSLIRTAYADTRSPWPALFRHAGCARGDVTELVGARGLEGALTALYRAGVYLTGDEMRGRRPVRRGATEIHVDPRRLRNPRMRMQARSHTSGAGGAPATIPVDLASVRERALNSCLVLEAWGGRDWRKALWTVPGRAVGGLVRLSLFGPPLERLFLLADPGLPGLHPRYRWSLRLVRWGGRLGGVRLPESVLALPGDPLPVARWVDTVVRAGATPYLFGYVSPVLRLVGASAAAGIELRGLRATVTGEPVTAARLAAIRQAGVEAFPDYGSAECGGSVSHGCFAPETSDDVHLFSDLHALVQAEPGDPGGLPAGALLMTSLRATAPLVLINVSMGDVARVGERRCGCPLETLGWTTHLTAIRSFEKLTAAGMTVLDAAAVRVLEEILPARFGGGPADYQLVEDHGDTRAALWLLVHPALGEVDPGAVAGAFLDALGTDPGPLRLMAAQWRAAGLPRVERHVPRSTAGAKAPAIYRVHRSGSARPPVPPPA